MRPVLEVRTVVRKRPSVHGVFLVVGLAVLHAGAVVGLLGAWSLSRLDTVPDADTGGAIAVMFGTAFFAIGLVLELTALVVWWAGRRSPAGRR